MTYKSILITEFVRMWPREIYNLKDGKKPLDSVRDPLRRKPGVYVLYRDDQPYYVGQARSLWARIRDHALNQNDKQYHHWTHFSAFIVSDVQYLSELESLVIVAMGRATANTARPKLKRVLLPADARRMLRQVKPIMSSSERG